MAKIVELPARTYNRAPDPKVVATVDELEKLLTKHGEGVWIGDEVVYESRTKAQSAVNRYRRMLVDERALVADKSKLGASIFTANGDGKFAVALAILSDADAAKTKARGAKISASRAK